jgi:RAQPRD family integrative conjugative element protein
MRVQEQGSKRWWGAWCAGLVALCVVGVVASPMARADEDSERERLAVISHELLVLQQLVSQAQRDSSSSTSTSARVRFSYADLLRELGLIRAGVDQHLEDPRKPRAVPPLRGDYRP